MVCKESNQTNKSPYAVSISICSYSCFVLKSCKFAFIISMLPLSAFLYCIHYIQTIVQSLIEKAVARGTDLYPYHISSCQATDTDR